MKDTYGSALSFVLFMFFFVVFVCFLAVSMNFARAYRVKNSVINILEQYKYDGGNLSADIQNELQSYLNRVRYNGVADSCSGQEFNGVCIIPVSMSDGSKYFKVVVYFSYDFGILDASGTVPVSGETRIIQ